MSEISPWVAVRDRFGGFARQLDELLYFLAKQILGLFLYFGVLWIQFVSQHNGVVHKRAQLQIVVQLVPEALVRSNVQDSKLLRKLAALSVSQRSGHG